MTINRQALITRRFPDIVQSYTARDCILYALGLGLGNDPLSMPELRHVYEQGLEALPTMATVIGQPGFWIGEASTGIDAARVVHGAQSLDLVRPMPVAAEMRGRSRIVDVVDKGASVGAAITVLTELQDTTQGDLVARLTSILIARGNGGFGGGGSPPSTKGAAEIPNGMQADCSIDRVLPAQSALIYRLSGDLNPLHVDPAAALAAGFGRPILHGLALFGVAGFSLMQIGMPSRLRSLSCRFSAPAFPGERVRTEIWTSGTTCFFRTSVLERGIVVLDRGRAAFE